MSGVAIGDMKRLQAFTERAAAETVEAGFNECEICGRSFSDQIRQDAEPALKTICGHYIGEHCLQVWTDKP